MELKKVKAGKETKYELSGVYSDTPIFEAIKQCGGRNAGFTCDYFDNEDGCNLVEIVFYSNKEITRGQIQLALRIIELEQNQHTHWWKR